MKNGSGIMAMGGKALRLPFVFLIALALSGCYLVEGAAQLAKMAGKASSSEQASSTEAAPTKPAAAAEEPPPPLAEGTQPAVSVKVEELPSK